MWNTIELKNATDKFKIKNPHTVRKGKTIKF